jgi:hypothetical protein
MCVCVLNQPINLKKFKNMKICHTTSRSRDSSVSVVTRLWAGQPGLDSRHGQGFLCLFHHVQIPSGVPGALSLRVKRPGREANHSSPSSAEVMNALSYSSTPPYVFMAWSLIKHRICLHGIRFPAEAGNFSLHHRVQNCSGAHPAS